MKRFDSPILRNPGILRREGARIPLKVAPSWTEDQIKRIETSPHTGKIVVKKVNGRSVRHQQSNPGERPAKLSGDLLKTYQSKRTGEYSAESSPDTEYTNRLQHDYGRVIVSDDDLKKAQEMLNEANDQMMKDLI